MGAALFTTGKGAQRLLQTVHKLTVTAIRTGPYIEMSIGRGTPMTPTIEDGVVTWRLPLIDGAVVHVALEDCAHYVRWLFDNPERANG